MRRRIEIYLLAYLSLVDFANYAVKSLDETKILSSSECLCMCVCWLCPDEFIFIGFVCCRFFSSAAHDFFEAYSQIPHTNITKQQTTENDECILPVQKSQMKCYFVKMVALPEL